MQWIKHSHPKNIGIAPTATLQSCLQRLQALPDSNEFLSSDDRSLRISLIREELQVRFDIEQTTKAERNVERRHREQLEQTREQVDLELAQKDQQHREQILVAKRQASRAELWSIIALVLALASAIASAFQAYFARPQAVPAKHPFATEGAPGAPVVAIPSGPALDPALREPVVPATSNEAAPATHDSSSSGAK